MEKTMDKKNKGFRTLMKAAKYGVFYAALILITVIGSADIFIPGSVTYRESDAKDSAVLAIADNVEEGGSYRVRAKLLGALAVKDVDVEVLPELRLVPGGEVFGVKFFTKGVIVIGTTDIETQSGFINPAEIAGLHKNDIITSVNGTEINTVEELAGKVEQSKGDLLHVKFSRSGEEMECDLRPLLSLSDKKYKTGIWVRDSTAGIGTITYYNPQNNCFAGLGHGICDIDTGEIMPLLRGYVVDVKISDIVKGKSGMPGELKGSFGSDKKGTLIGNTDCGVYGVIDEPDTSFGQALPIASKDEVLEGSALIRLDPDGTGVREYEVNLSKIDRKSIGTKSFVVEITDADLLSVTGGIVQGMSGSPIIQNGKLVGAVTHVLVSDPTKGYGIFIENMLSKMPELVR